MENEVVIPTVYGDDVTWGNVGKDIVVSRFWEVYFNDIMRGPDEVLVQQSEIEVGEVEDGIVKVTITPDADLKKDYPEGLVVIDGKWHDLAILDSPIALNAARAHRISIVWSQETLVETFILAPKA